MSLFEDLKPKAQEEDAANVKDLQFKASHVWFDRFKARANFHSLGTSGGSVRADVAAATKFP
jgi:hypothetical protein